MSEKIEWGWEPIGVIIVVICLKQFSMVTGVAFGLWYVTLFGVGGKKRSLRKTLSVPLNLYRLLGNG
jgi:hypothetical protein